MRLAAQAYRPRSAITAYGRGLVTTVHGPSKFMTHARQPESLRDRGQDGCEHARLIRYQHQALQPGLPGCRKLVDITLHPKHSFAACAQIQASVAHVDDMVRAISRAKLEHVARPHWGAINENLGQALATKHFQAPSDPLKLSTSLSSDKSEYPPIPCMLAHLHRSACKHDTAGKAG